MALPYEHGCPSEYKVLKACLHVLRCCLQQYVQSQSIAVSKCHGEHAQVVSTGPYGYVLVGCRCSLPAADCQNQLPCDGVYKCTARILRGEGALSTEGALTLSGAYLHVDGGSIELQLPMTANLPPSNNGVVYIDL